MSAARLSQVQSQTQQLTIAPQLRQALKVLQVGALELRSTILEELQTNPALEEMPTRDVSLDAPDAPPSSSDKDSAEGGSDAESSNTAANDDYEPTYDNAEKYSAEAAKRRQFFFDSITAEESLQEHLMSQASLTDADEPTLKALEYIIGALDDRGFLTMDVAAIAQQASMTADTIEKALKLLKTLDPQGLGSRDLQECLLGQLDTKGQSDSLTAHILRDHYPLFLRRRIPELSKALDRKPEEIEDALKVIAELDPAPGRRFAEDMNRVVMPDAKVFKEGDKWQIELMRDYLPRLKLSANFKQYLADKRLTPTEKEFLQEKLKAGRQLISAIEQRQATIERISRLLLEIQEGFFEAGVEKLKPLTMAQIAEKIGVHETTVSRAIANKYISTPHGVFPYKFFFTPGYTNSEGQTVSNKSIKDKIAQLIADESPQKPLSDQTIAEILKKENIDIARRTVAKYREELGVLPTHLRRQFTK